MTAALGATIAKSPGVLAQTAPTDSTLVLLNPRSGEYFTLEAVGPRVWQLCDGQRTLSEIATMSAITNQIAAHAHKGERFFITYTPVAPHMPFDSPAKQFVPTTP